MSRTPFAALALAALAVGLLGCEPNLEVVTLAAVTTPPVSISIRNDNVRLAAGTGVGLRLDAYTDDRDDPPLEPGSLDVRSRDQNVVSVRHVEDSTYIVVGARPGTTIIEVSSTDAAGVVEIVAEVVEQ